MLSSPNTEKQETNLVERTCVIVMVKKVKLICQVSQFSHNESKWYTGKMWFMYTHTPARCCGIPNVVIGSG